MIKYGLMLSVILSSSSSVAGMPNNLLSMAMVLRAVATIKATPQVIARAYGMKKGMSENEKKNSAAYYEKLMDVIDPLKKQEIFAIMDKLNLLDKRIEALDESLCANLRKEHKILLDTLCTAVDNAEKEFFEGRPGKSKE
jgi:hypothetical protein